MVVTGGSGGLGREVMRALADLGRPALAASRRTGFDLATGAGLGHVLAHAEVVIHAATHPLRPRTVDLDGTRRMIKVLQREGPPPHLVYVSIVGCDRNPYPYYRAKHACEVALQRSGLPVTVVRATQFHSLVEAIARGATLGPIALAPKLTFQSCDPAWVAGRLVEVALGRPPVGFLRGDDPCRSGAGHLGRGDHQDRERRGSAVAQAAHPARHRWDAESLRRRLQPA